MPKSKRNIHAVAEETLTPPATLTPTQKIARVKNAAGNSLYNLQLPGSTGDEALLVLAELPAKFRNTIWIKRGSYVLVDTTSLADRSNKLGGEIINIVRDEKAWRKMPYWPAEFAVIKNAAAASTEDEEDDEEDDGPKYPPSENESE